MFPRFNDIPEPFALRARELQALTAFLVSVAPADGCFHGHQCERARFLKEQPKYRSAVGLGPETKHTKVFCDAVCALALADFCSIMLHPTTAKPLSDSQR